jgi:hypothetical protein
MCFTSLINVSLYCSNHCVLMCVLPSQFTYILSLIQRNSTEMFIIPTSYLSKLQHWDDPQFECSHRTVSGGAEVSTQVLVSSSVSSHTS